MASLDVSRALVVALVAGSSLVGCGSSTPTKAPGSTSDGGADTAGMEAAAEGGSTSDGAADVAGPETAAEDGRDATAAEGGPFTPPARCALPFDTGPCDAAIRVFAFVGGTCVQKSYGGCQGNDNRFSTLEECLATCEGRPAVRTCPAGRHQATICLQCGVFGGCPNTKSVCALDCTKDEDCAAEGPRPTGCFMGACEAFGCL